MVWPAAKDRGGKVRVPSAAARASQRRVIIVIQSVRAASMRRAWGVGYVDQRKQQGSDAGVPRQVHPVRVAG
jgi:hypothetical protein